MGGSKSAAGGQADELVGGDAEVVTKVISVFDGGGETHVLVNRLG